MAARVRTSDLALLLENIQKQLAELSARVSRLETSPVTAAPSPAEAAPPKPAPAPEAEITEEEMVAVSAAVAAYLGVRAPIKQIRLLSSRSWAQEGRVSIQASHRLHP